MKNEIQKISKVFIFSYPRRQKKNSDHKFSKIYTLISMMCVNLSFFDAFLSISINTNEWWIELEEVGEKEYALIWCTNKRYKTFTHLHAHLYFNTMHYLYLCVLRILDGSSNGSTEFQLFFACSIIVFGAYASIVSFHHTHKHIHTHSPGHSICLK